MVTVHDMTWYMTFRDIWLYGIMWYITCGLWNDRVYDITRYMKLCSIWYGYEMIWYMKWYGIWHYMVYEMTCYTVFVSLCSAVWSQSLASCYSRREHNSEGDRRPISQQTGCIQRSQGRLTSSLLVWKFQLRFLPFYFTLSCTSLRYSLVAIYRTAGEK